MPDRRSPTRRQLLALAGTLAAGGAVPACATSEVPGAGAVADDAATARQAARSAAGLLAHYRATVRRHPDLRPRLASLAAHHAEHVSVLAPEQEPPAGSPLVPRAQGAALAALRRREQAVLRSRRAAVSVVTSGELARILASVVACQAQHLVLLDGPAR